MLVFRTISAFQTEANTNVVEWFAIWKILVQYTKFNGSDPMNERSKYNKVNANKIMINCEWTNERD